MVSCISQSTLNLKYIQIHENKIKGEVKLSKSYSNSIKYITCPNFVRKLLPMFRDVTATSSLDLSAWAIAKAPSSCESDNYGIRDDIISMSYESKIKKEHIHTLISLNPKSREVKASLTTFKLRARLWAPCNSWFIKQ